MKRLVLLALLVALCGSPAQALRVPSAPHCTIFPKTNAWNKRVDSLPVAPDSDAELAERLAAYVDEVRARYPAVELL